MNITLKNVPEKVYQTVKRAAKEQGRSLNAQIIHALEAEAAEFERRKRTAKWLPHEAGHVQALPRALKEHRSGSSRSTNEFRLPASPNHRAFAIARG